MDKSKAKEVLVKMSSNSQNESLARVIASQFIVECDPTVEELVDVKTAVSEAVTNCIIHGYKNREGEVRLYLRLEGSELYIEVEDFGCGIENIEEAMRPMYTSLPEQERSGMGFAIMLDFMDSVEVESIVGGGTVVKMRKKIGS